MSNFDLDDTNRHILVLLQDNARLPFAEIGRQVGLTAPAVAERVRRLEEEGIITGYHAAVNPDRLGLPLRAYITVTATDGRCEPIRRYALDQPTVTECYCIAGDRDILLKASLESVAQLQALANDLLRFGKVSTSLVLETYLARRALGRDES
jgi:Lrp/AsnC family leucine-responsive transcriptional regulator